VQGKKCIRCRVRRSLTITVCGKPIERCVFHAKPATDFT
jgi:hypothetical protein